MEPATKRKKRRPVAAAVPTQSKRVRPSGKADAMERELLASQSIADAHTAIVRDSNPTASDLEADAEEAQASHEPRIVSAAAARRKLDKSHSRMLRRVKGQSAFMRRQRAKLAREEKRRHDATLAPLTRLQQARLRRLREMLKHPRRLLSESKLIDMAAKYEGMRAAEGSADGKHGVVDLDVIEREARQKEILCQEDMLHTFQAIEKLFRDELESTRELTFTVERRLTAMERMITQFRKHMLQVISNIEIRSIPPQTVMEVWQRPTSTSQSVVMSAASSIFTPAPAAIEEDKQTESSRHVTFPNLPFADTEEQRVRRAAVAVELMRESSAATFMPV